MLDIYLSVKTAGAFIGAFTYVPIILNENSNGKMKISTSQEV